jgi:hypothetical protein
MCIDKKIEGTYERIHLRYNFLVEKVEGLDVKLRFLNFKP